MSSFGELFFALAAAHFLCDFPLQGDFLARAKNPCAPIAGVPWWWAMIAHCSIHSAAVWWLTHSAICTAVEFAHHFAIDVVKCRGSITFAQDQAAHLLMKATFAFLISKGLM